MSRITLPSMENDEAADADANADESLEQRIDDDSVRR